MEYMTSSDALKNLFSSQDILCHYTSAETLPLILKNGLKFGRLCEMNDVFESTKRYFYDLEKLSSMNIPDDDVDQELRRYRQISFSRDNSPKRAFMLWQMWGHYADKGKGVCLVFQRSALIESIPSQYNYSEIEYTDDENNTIVLTEPPLPFFKHNMKKIFFEKYHEWGYEQEFRVVGAFDDDGDHFLPIDGSLKCIIALAEQFESIRSKIAGYGIPCLSLADFGGNWNLKRAVESLDPVWDQISMGHLDEDALKSINLL